MIPVDYSYNEIFPKIFVYKKLYPDHNILYELMKNSLFQSYGYGAYTSWDDWFIFGKYCHAKSIEQITLDIQKKLEEDRDYNFHLLDQELYLHKRLTEAVASAIANYVSINSIELPADSFITKENIGRYNPGVDSGEGKTMQYHTDYGIGEWYWPGEKFLLTATSYMNDDYDGGEIIFSVGSELISYKPEAGDIIVFPSGSPLYPGNEPYFHSVAGIRGGHKFLVRTYLKHIVEGHEKWYQNEEKYGKEKWYEIAKSRAEGHNTIAIFDGQPKICSALITKLYGIPIDTYEVKQNVFYDDDEI